MRPCSRTSLQPLLRARWLPRMPASFRMLLSRGRSDGGALLSLLGLLPCGGFGSGALLGLLGSGGLLSCRRFRRCMLLRLLPCGDFGSGALLGLLGSGGLLSCCRFRRCMLLRLLSCGGFGCTGVRFSLCAREETPES